MPDPELPKEELRDGTIAAIVLGLLYFSFGALWILLSDEVVTALAPDPSWLQLAQRYKGLAYVLITTLGLVGLVRLSHQHLLQARWRAFQSDLQAQDLFERHPLPGWVSEPDSGRILRVNEAAVRAFGYSRQELLAMRQADLLRGEARLPEGVDTPSGTAPSPPAASPAASPGAYRSLRLKNGNEIVVRVLEHLVRLGDKPARMASVEDVTRQLEVQQALARQQQQFEQLHESLGEVLWMATPDGHTILYVSPAFETIYGRSRAELMASPGLWLEAIVPEDRPRALDLPSAGTTPLAAPSQYRIRRPDGSLRWIEDRKRIIRDERGRAVLLCGIAEDITVRQERDQALEQMNSELGRLVAERTRELEAANQELDAFSRTAAHDLKTPLNGIAGLSDLLRLKYADTLDETGQRYVVQIGRSARTMASLVDDLLTLARTGSNDLSLSWVDLLPDVQAVVDGLRAAEPQRGVTLDLPPAIPAYCDRGLMVSVLQNLLGNAWKFSARTPQARIRIDAGTDEAGAVLTVADNGCGFDATGISGQFQPFKRFHSQAEFPGSGLGLATCQRIVRRHGGRLEVQSTPGAGAVVRVHLPGPVVA